MANTEATRSDPSLPTHGCVCVWVQICASLLPNLLDRASPKGWLKHP